MNMVVMKEKAIKRCANLDKTFEVLWVFIGFAMLSSFLKIVGFFGPNIFS